MASTTQRDASRLFSTALFRRLLAGRRSELADAITTRLRANLGFRRTVDNATVVQAAYDVLRHSYRCEYYYRNLITNKIFVGRHRAINSVLINELRIRDSIADCVIINGSATVYEIKTELDSPDKLATQLANYYRAFTKVNIVINERDIHRYERPLRETHAGLIAVGIRGHLSTIRPAVEETEKLDIRSMFNILRTQEAESILSRCIGHIPNVPNGLRYSTHLKLAQSIPPQLFQEEMQRALKSRTLKYSRDLMLDPEFVPLRAIIAQLDPDDTERRNLLSWLQSRAS